MTVRHMYIFKTVCECQSITAAAGKLNMTQPAVSVAIKELESFYQVKLFERMNRTIYLTEAGNTLREYADSILDQFEEAEAVLRDGTSMARCRMGVNVSVGETFLPGMLKLLEEKIPGIHMEVLVGNTVTIEEKLNENEIDFAVVDGLKDQTRRVIQPLFRGEMAAVCTPSYGPHGPVTVKELAGYRLLLREKGSGNRVCIDAMFESHGCSARPVVDSISDLSLLKLAEEGFGITILPRELAAEQLAAGRLKEVKLTDDTLERQYFIAYNKKKYLTGRMKEVLQVLKL